jgi:hypothetical protein
MPWKNWGLSIYDMTAILGCMPDEIDACFQEGYVTNEAYRQQCLERKHWEEDLSSDELQVSCRDHGAATHYQESNISFDEVQWRYEADFPVERLLALMGNRKAWVSWFIKECHMQEEDNDNSGYYKSLVTEDIQDSVLLFELPDGRVDISDGWHRLAACILKNQATIRAVVGCPKAELKLSL